MLTFPTSTVRNPETNAGFYIVQQATTTSQALVTFSANLNTSQGPAIVPSISLNGRQSKILVTDYNFGSSTLVYSSVDVLTYGIFDVNVVVLYLEEGQAGQFALRNAPNAVAYQVFGPTELTANSSNSSTTFTYVQSSGSTVLKFNKVLVYLLDQQTAWRFWAPSTTNNPDVNPSQQIFVLGPYLVRSAFASNGTIHIAGDNDNATTIEVYYSEIQTIYWNGLRLDGRKTPYGAVIAHIPGSESRAVSFPPLVNWRSADSLPEKRASYDDSRWVVCNKTTTLSPVAPLTKPVLFSSDYGYYTGAVRIIESLVPQSYLKQDAYSPFNMS